MSVYSMRNASKEEQDKIIFVSVSMRCRVK